MASELLTLEGEWVPGPESPYGNFVPDEVQPVQINMTVFFWYLLKIDLSSVHENWISHFLQWTINTRPSIIGHPVREHAKKMAGVKGGGDFVWCNFICLELIFILSHGIFLWSIRMYILLQWTTYFIFTFWIHIE